MLAPGRKIMNINRKAVGVIVIAYFCCWGALAFFLGYNQEQPKFRELSKEQLTSSVVTVPTFPMSIDLEIVSVEDFQRMRPKPTTEAFSNIYRSPCRIVIPDGWKLVFSPSAR